MAKRNLAKIPAAITEKIAALGNQRFRVGCVRKIAESEVAEGNYDHAGLTLKGGDLAVTPSVLPASKIGKYSKRNVEGRTVVRRDLPKIQKQIDLGERPIYGDWNNGSFSLWVTRMVYQRDSELPRNLRIRVRHLDTEELNGRKFVLVFEVDGELQAGAANFGEDLLFHLNLLHENVGATDVIATDVTDEELLHQLYVNWELLPPGERDATLAAIFQKARAEDVEQQQRLRQRYDMLAEFGPERWVVGTRGFHGYFGAMFQTHVYLENVEYGNAMYRFDRSNWQPLSQLTRTELLREHDGEFQRFVHRPGWQEVVRHELEAE